MKNKIGNDKCSICKKSQEHNGVIVLNLNTGKGVHKSCEYKGCREG